MTSGSAAPHKSASRPRPLPDPVSEPFWTAARRGELHVQYCESCTRYQFPPAPLCTSCSGEVRYRRVSGGARLHSYTQTVSGARHSWFAERVPYLSGLAELDAQPGLLLSTNLPGLAPEQLAVGLELQLRFDVLDDGTAIPQFGAHE